MGERMSFMNINGKNVLQAWDNRVEWTVISDPGMGPHIGTEHCTTTVMTQFKDGVPVLETKTEGVLNFDPRCPYQPLTDIINIGIPVIPKDEHNDQLS